MKIKTITCHEVYNVGASLQAYALQKYLQNLGHDVEIIDYKPKYLVSHKLLGVGNSIYNKPILRELYQIAKFPGRIKERYGKRKKEFDKFTKKYLSVTSQKYTSNEELKRKIPEADIYFAGSDQIWNTLFNNGKDPAFYLEFAPENVIKASYAASFATEDVLEEWKPRVRGWLNNFDFLSVRESSGVKIAKQLTNKKVVQVLDPVFLLEKAIWEKIEKPVHGLEPYILLYDFDNNSCLNQWVYKLAKNKGWKVYSFLKNDKCDKCFDKEGPEVFLWLIHHAEFVVSNSFHATAFSIIYQKQFVVFDRKEAINTRMRDLLSTFGIKNSKDLNEIDYRIVSIQQKKYVEQSKNYIAEVLNARGKV